MQTREMDITNPTGLHTRPGNLFVKKAKEFNASVTLVKGDKAVNAKSLLTLLKAGISMGDHVAIVTEGPDELLAAEALAALLASFTE